MRRQGDKKKRPETSAYSSQTGPNSGEYKVLRGGSWHTGPGSVQSATRDRFAPDDRRNFVGFRCARGSQ